jgi:SET domain-containing protein
MIREEGIPGGPHRLRLPKERRNIVVDPGPYEDVAGRYANDASRVGGNNCSFASELHNLRALLVADKDIGADEEIFVDYGGSYWEPDPPIEGDDKSLTSRNACKFKGGGFDEDLPERKRIEAERRRKEEAKKEEEEGKNEERYVVG